MEGKFGTPPRDWLRFCLSSDPCWLLVPPPADTKLRAGDPHRLPLPSEDALLLPTLALVGVRGRLAAVFGVKALPEGRTAVLESRWEALDEDDLVEERERVRGGKVRGIREGGMASQGADREGGMA